MPRELAVAIASAPRIHVAGQFQRHFSPKSRGLTGSTSGGRWGPPRAFSVLYLGRPRNSIVVEAYRHLVDPFAAEGMTGDMISPRRLLTCEVDVTDVLDLTSDEGQAAVGLEDDDLASPVGEWGPCQHVARVAHQLGVHGILAPAATRMGETHCSNSTSVKRNCLSSSRRRPGTDSPEIRESSASSKVKDQAETVGWVARCRNFDGPSDESTEDCLLR